jgi:hypothetical protein
LLLMFTRLRLPRLLRWLLLLIGWLRLIRCERSLCDEVSIYECSHLRRLTTLVFIDAEVELIILMQLMRRILLTRRGEERHQRTTDQVSQIARHGCGLREEIGADRHAIRRRTMLMLTR